MPFGPCNASATFRTFINFILSPYLDDFCTAYLDNILVYSNTEEEHEDHVNEVFAKLDEAGLYLDINKCAFFVKQVKYLGLIITTEGIQMNPQKNKCILEWKASGCLHDVQAFLGFANFYRRFIFNYSGLARHFSALKPKRVWTFHGNLTAPKTRHGFSIVKTSPLNSWLTCDPTAPADRFSTSQKLARRSHRTAHEDTIAASASIMNKIMRVRATPGTLKVGFHGPRKSVMDVIEQFVGRNEVEADLRQMVRWAVKKDQETTFRGDEHRGTTTRMETIEEVDVGNEGGETGAAGGDEDTVMEDTEV